MAVWIFIVILAYLLTGIVRNCLYICTYCMEIEDRKAEEEEEKEKEAKTKKKLV